MRDHADRPANRLLAALPRDEYACLAPLSWPFTLSAVRSWHSRFPTARKSAWME
jgi:hypothetical protein